ncbi:hypothetical protein KQI61_07710 [Anaerocolumna aminovalerica]|uniref:hypothetical protein n=1 Tax=Anaerocolumna aminovalerica TaxID=1527 RepID=UPI001C0F39AB|nr:hypothetical protein [Anaerocolumna aminovalerica]MBU5332082.1 hypothetical protein [Anaerocolumna aminovalerica]
MENNKKTNLINNRNSFWRNDILWRTTSTGLNSNVISQFAPTKDYNQIVKYIKRNEKPYTDGRKYLPTNKNERHTYFINLVNDALKDIWHGNKGYCYSTDQLKEIIKIIPQVKARYDEDDGCWYCWL